MHSQLTFANPLLVALAVVVLSISANSLAAAENRFEGSIKKFEAADKENPPEEGGILFVGSSSIRMWKLDKWFPDREALNRGFGGSQISDVLHFYDRVVLPYKPSVIVFYSGDNDIGAGKSPEQVNKDFRQLQKKLEKDLPETKFVLIPAKPSIKRWNLWEKMSQANALNAEAAAENENFTVVDIVTPMLGEDGKPQKELFANDGLHLSEAGYQIWSDLVKEKLKAWEK